MISDKKKTSRSGYISGHNVHRTLINGLFSCFLLHPVFTTYRVLYDCILRDMNNEDFLNATEYVRSGSGRKLAPVGSRPKMVTLAMLPNWFFRTIGRIIRERKKYQNTGLSSNVTEIKNPKGGFIKLFSFIS